MTSFVRGLTPVPLMLIQAVFPSRLDSYRGVLTRFLDAAPSNIALHASAVWLLAASNRRLTSE